MTGRLSDVLRVAGVSPEQVVRVEVEEVRQALANRLSEQVLQVATQEPATYWRVGNRYFLDDQLYGDVVDMEQLDYNDEIGLFVKGEA